MKIYLIRHGQTEWNKEERFQGQKNSNLTNKGINQAQELGAFFKDNNIKFGKIFCSPLGRTRQTAAYLDLEANIVYDKRLMEISLGRWEGEKYSAIKDFSEKLDYAFWNEPLKFIDESAETYKELCDRLIDFFNDVCETIKSEESILVISHGAVIRTIYSFFEFGRLDNIPFRKVPSSGTYSLVEYDKTRGFNVINYERYI